MIARRFIEIKMLAPLCLGNTGRNVSKAHWGLFKGALGKFNANRRRNILLSLVLFTADSMCAFRPRSTMYGGRPNISHITRKPEPRLN
jgi:hypothetical protein